MVEFSSCEFYIEERSWSWTALIACSVLTSVREHGWAALMSVSCHKSWWWPARARPMEIGRSWWSQGPAHELSHFRTFQRIFLLLQIKTFSSTVIMWKSRFEIVLQIPTTGDKQQIVSLHLHARRIKRVSSVRIICVDVTCQPSADPRKYFQAENNTNTRSNATSSHEKRLDILMSPSRKQSQI